jgi:hypothetical protein
MKKGFVLAATGLLFGMLSPGFSQADTIDSGTLSFQTTNQSMWSSGSAFIFNYNPTLVNIPVNASTSLGPGTGCVLGVCAGYSLDANVSGNVGMNASLAVSGGTVDATLPVNVSLGFPNTVQNNSTVDITSSALFGTGSLTTASPSVQASLGVFANLKGGISASGCILVACDSGGTSFNTHNATATLFSVDSRTFPPQTLPLGGSVDLTIGAPYVQTSGTSAPPISTSGSSPFLGLNADITNLAAGALGFPPVNGSINLPLGIGGIDYNLAKLTAGLTLNTTQAFNLTAQPLVAYDVSITGSNPTSFSSGPLAVGSPFSFTIPTGDTAAFVTPTYLMSAMLNNNTGGALSAQLGFSALGLSTSGVFSPLGNVGPLVNTSRSFPVTSFSVFNNTFALQGWNAFQGNTFQIAATSTPTSAAPEPGTLTLLGFGMLAMAWFMRKGRRSAKI